VSFRWLAPSNTADSTSHCPTLHGQRDRPDEAKELFEADMAIWRKRSKKQWRIAVALPFLRQYPQLAALDRSTTSHLLPFSDCSHERNQLKHHGKETEPFKQLWGASGRSKPN
jgi:hypothetical protein